MESDHKESNDGLIKNTIVINPHMLGGIILGWTEYDIPDLSNKIVVVTGANSGIGFEATRLFAKKNAEVIMACRSVERANDALLKIKGEYPQAKISILDLDLSCFSSIHHFSKEMHKKYHKIDILLNNAGVMMTSYQTTQDGLELQQGINYFGHFLLTKLLFDLLDHEDQSRIVNISSIAHRLFKLRFNNLLFENGKGYRKLKAYSRSKLEMLMFTYKLARLVEESNKNILVLAAHPGVSKTNLGHYIHKTPFYKFWNIMMRRFAQSAYQGAMPGIRAATDSKALNKQFYGPNGFLGIKGYPVVTKSTRYSKKRVIQDKLWSYSELRTNVQFIVK
jgi:NAD(P)-dependent dehydrogenase (short-subunit alcohol dehydrogenase family)